MTVQRLIEILQGMPQDATVYVRGTWEAYEIYCVHDNTEEKRFDKYTIFPEATNDRP